MGDAQGQPIPQARIKRYGESKLHRNKTDKAYAAQAGASEGMMRHRRI